MAMRCDNCGKFSRHLNPVWCNPRSGGIDREICDACNAPAADEEASE